MKNFADFSHSQQRMSQAMRSAVSPKCWQRSMSNTLKPAFSVFYGYQWLKDIKVEPQLSREPLLGRCLGQILEIKQEDSQEQVAKATLKKKPAYYTTETTKAKTRHHESHASSAEKPSLSPTKSEKGNTLAKLHKPTEVSKTRSVNQVMVQQKTAEVTSLHDWMQKDKTSKHTASSISLNKGITPKHRGAITFAKKAFNNSPASIKAPTYNVSKWQRHVDQNIKMLTSQTASHGMASSTMQKRSLKHSQQSQNKASALSLWQQKLTMDNQDTKISLNTLQYLLVKHEQFNSPTSVENKNVYKNEAAEAHKTGRSLSPGLPSLANKKNLRKNLASQKTGTRKQQNESDTSIEANVQEKTTEPLASTQTTKNRKSAAMTSSDPHITAPEFPPVGKMINESLQVSGKRTALKKETQLLAPHEHILDDEKLADAFKRIIDQQARRHGIDV